MQSSEEHGAGLGLGGRGLADGGGAGLGGAVPEAGPGHPAQRPEGVRAGLLPGLGGPNPQARHRLVRRSLQDRPRGQKHAQLFRPQAQPGQAKASQGLLRPGSLLQAFSLSRLANRLTP